MAAPRVDRCPKCNTALAAPAEHRDGLPGVRYRECPACGYTRAVTRKPRRERLEVPKTVPHTRADGSTVRVTIPEE